MAARHLKFKPSSACNSQDFDETNKVIAPYLHKEAGKVPANYN